MLPSRAYSHPMPQISMPARTRAVEVAPTLLVGGSTALVEIFPAAPFTRIGLQSTADLLTAIERTRPRVVAIDWDDPQIDGLALCAAAARVPHSAILVMTESPQRVPPALRAGCNAVLLKPFAPNLLAARLGRLFREVPLTDAAARGMAVLRQTGTNRTWADVSCPTCQRPDAVSFEFASYRRMWYACLGCDAAWLGPRRE